MSTPKPSVFYSQDSDNFTVTYKVNYTIRRITIRLVCEEKDIESTRAKFATFNEDYKDLNCSFFDDNDGGYRIRVKSTSKRLYIVGCVCFYNSDVARQFLELVISSPQFWFEFNTDTSYLTLPKILWDKHDGKVEKHVLEVMDAFPSVKTVLETTRTI
jgi:hypothetical protein